LTGTEKERGEKEEENNREGRPLSRSMRKKKAKKFTAGSMKRFFFPSCFFAFCAFAVKNSFWYYERKEGRR
jgi:hypothetical protein